MDLQYFLNRRRLKEYERRQEAACNPHWKTLIPREDTKRFIKTEGAYCYIEETEFNTCDHKDVVKTEKLRTIVLEKRKEFLMLWLKTYNIPIPNNKNNKKETKC